MTHDLTEFEIKVLRAFCEKAGSPVSNLVDQLEALKVKSRDLSGVGVFVEFEPAGFSNSGPSAVVSGVNGLGADGSVDIGFLLFVRGGAIEMLEGFSYTGSWPGDLTSYRIVIE